MKTIENPSGWHPETQNPWIFLSIQLPRMENSYQSSHNFLAKLLAVSHSKFWSPGAKILYITITTKSLQNRSSVRFFCFFPVPSWMVADHTPLGKTVTSSTDSLDCCLEPCFELGREGTCLEPDLHSCKVETWNTWSKNKVKRKRRKSLHLASWISQSDCSKWNATHIQPYQTLSTPPAMSFRRRSSPWHFTSSTPPPFWRVPLRRAARIWRPPIRLVILPQVIPGAMRREKHQQPHVRKVQPCVFLGTAKKKKWFFFGGVSVKNSESFQTKYHHVVVQEYLHH